MVITSKCRFTRSSSERDASVVVAMLLIWGTSARVYRVLLYHLDGLFLLEAIEVLGGNIQECATLERRTSLYQARPTETDKCINSKALRGVHIRTK
jgi:hypothetical protein